MGWGQRPPTPSLLSPLPALTLPGVIGVGDPSNPVWTPIKAEHSFLLQVRFLGMEARPSPRCGPGTGAAVVREGPVGAGRASVCTPPKRAGKLLLRPL